MKVNKKDFKDGEKYYLSLTNFVLDRSGNCELVSYVETIKLL